MSNLFRTYHPAVAFVYMACAIAFSMAVMQPVFVALSLMGAIACSCVTRGARRTMRALAGVAVLALIVAAANLVFVASGSTELFRVGVRAFYVESLVYGICSGGMLASVLLWFASYAACMDSDASMAMFGNAAPTVTLMVSQVMRLVPQFVSRGRGIVASQDAVTSAEARTKRQAASDRLRAVSVLAGWGMEDGLVRGDAMRARGYDCGVRRTTYRRHRIRRVDAAALVVVGVLAAASASCAWAAVSEFAFYPVLGGFAPLGAYLSYALLMAFAPALAFKEWLQWR